MHCTCFSPVIQENRFSVHEGKKEPEYRLNSGVCLRSGVSVRVPIFDASHTNFRKITLKLVFRIIYHRCSNGGNSNLPISPNLKFPNKSTIKKLIFRGTQKEVSAKSVQPDSLPLLSF